MSAPEGPPPGESDRDRPRSGEPTDKPLFGTTPGQKISRALLVVGLLLMLWVVYVLTKALG